MADDERRAEIEAVARALVTEGCGPGWAWPRAHKIIAVLDRVRDARGDEELRVALNQTRCSGCTEVVRDEEPLRFRSGVLWHEACLAARDARGERTTEHNQAIWRAFTQARDAEGRSVFVAVMRAADAALAARSPQSEDHETAPRETK